MTGQTPVVTIQSHSGRTPLVQGVSVSADQPTQLVHSHTGLTPQMQGMTVSNEHSGEMVHPTPDASTDQSKLKVLPVSLPGIVHRVEHEPSPVCKVRLLFM